MWKRRFAILRLGIKLNVNTAMGVIIATVVLHNMTIEMNEEEILNDEDEENHIRDVHNDIDEGVWKSQHICSVLFITQNLSFL